MLGIRQGQWTIAGPFDTIVRMSPPLYISLLGVQTLISPVENTAGTALWLHELTRTIGEVAAEPMHRQKRTAVEYWDGLTFVDRTGANFPEAIRLSPEHAVLAETLQAIKSNRTEEAPLKQLSELNHWPQVRMSFERLSAQLAGFTDAAIGASGMRALLTPPNPRREGGIGVFRLLSLDHSAVPFDGTPEELLHLLELVLLVQLREDLSTWIETRYLRVGCCARPACAGWFRRKPMGLKQKFCSDTCRAAMPREGG